MFAVVRHTIWSTIRDYILSEESVSQTSLKFVTPWQSHLYWSKRVLCIGIITFWNFTIINCGLSCSLFCSVVFYCCGLGKPFQVLYPNCCLVFQRFVVNFLQCTCLCYSGWLLLFDLHIKAIVIFVFCLKNAQTDKNHEGPSRILSVPTHLFLVWVPVWR